jgi:hypothetical protein
MRILDINRTHKLALVGDDHLTDINYVRLDTLPADAVPEEDFAYVHLKQAHYCAQHVVLGLSVNRALPELAGWQRWDACAKYWTRT